MRRPPDTCARGHKGWCQKTAPCAAIHVRFASHRPRHQRTRTEKYCRAALPAAATTPDSWWPGTNRFVTAVVSPSSSCAVGLNTRSSGATATPDDAIGPHTARHDAAMSRPMRAQACTSTSTSTGPREAASGHCCSECGTSEGERMACRQCRGAPSRWTAYVQDACTCEATRQLNEPATTRQS
jgi:hypothetical protein